MLFDNNERGSVLLRSSNDFRFIIEFTFQIMFAEGILIGARMTLLHGICFSFHCHCLCEWSVSLWSNSTDTFQMLSTMSCTIATPSVICSLWYDEGPKVLWRVKPLDFLILERGYVFVRVCVDGVCFFCVCVWGWAGSFRSGFLELGLCVTRVWVSVCVCTVHSLLV